MECALSRAFIPAYARDTRQRRQPALSFELCRQRSEFLQRDRRARLQYRPR